MIRVAFSAYACKFSEGSEPGAGFLWALAAAEVAHVTLLTRPLDATTRAELQRAGIEVHELEVRHSRKIPQLSYIRWLVQAQSKLQEIHAIKAFELVHHATYATDWLPAPSIKGVPMIWGPVGGSTGLPAALGANFSKQLQMKEAIRSIVTACIRQITKKWASKRVSILLAQNRDTAKSYEKIVPVHIRPNYIVEDKSFPDSTPTKKRIAMVGRLIEMKGVHLAIAAMAQPELSDWELHIVGDGPMRKYLENNARISGVADRVIFHGQVARQDVYRHLRQATCSLLLSTHDAAGWSAAESISVGTPVHTWSHGGPAELVTSTGCGSVINPGADCVRALAASITTLEDKKGGDMSDFYFDAVVRDLKGWYDDATK